MKNKFKLPKKIIIGKSEIKIIQKDLSKIYPNKAGYLKPIYKKKFIIYLDSKLENQDIKNTLYHDKGKPKRISESVNQLVFSRLREHSRKPDEVRNKIIKLVGDLPKIELFGRERIEGWDSYGNELPNHIQKNLNNEINK